MLFYDVLNEKLYRIPVHILNVHHGLCLRVPTQMRSSKAKSASLQRHCFEHNCRILSQLLSRKWQKMQAGDAKMEVPWRISWLQVSGSICKHLHLVWQIHLQSTKEHKRTISALSGSILKHGLGCIDGKKLHFSSPLPRPQMQTEAIKDC